MFDDFRSRLWNSLPFGGDGCDPIVAAVAMTPGLTMKRYGRLVAGYASRKIGSEAGNDVQPAGIVSASCPPELPAHKPDIALLWTRSNAHQQLIRAIESGTNRLRGETLTRDFRQDGKARGPPCRTAAALAPGVNRTRISTTGAFACTAPRPRTERPNQGR
jgi:hypothetical protein